MRLRLFFGINAVLFATLRGGSKPPPYRRLEINLRWEMV
jgi:hypothetical protein